jgi:hypothetical protein
MRHVKLGEVAVKKAEILVESEAGAEAESKAEA